MDFSYVPCEYREMIFFFHTFFFLKADSFFHWLLLDVTDFFFCVILDINLAKLSLEMPKDYTVS